MYQCCIDDANDIYLLPTLLLSSSQADAAAYEAVDGYGNSRRRSNRRSYGRGYARGATNSWSYDDRREFRNGVRDRCDDRYGR